MKKQQKPRRQKHTRPYSTERRQHLLQLLEARPWQTVSDLTKHFDVMEDTVRHHLRALQVDGAVVVRIETLAERDARVRKLPASLAARNGYYQQRVVYAPAHLFRGAS